MALDSTQKLASVLGLGDVGLLPFGPFDTADLQELTGWLYSSVAGADLSATDRGTITGRPRDFDHASRLRTFTLWSRESD